MRRSSSRFLAASLSFGLGLSAIVAEEDLEFFEKRIRPVLSEKCYGCHSATAEKLKGSLQLDHREHMLSGGETGAAIEPGDPEASLLIESIRYGNEDLQMPPKEKLSAEVVADFETWIAAGAPWPEESVPVRGEAAGEEAFDLWKRQKEHWSWRSVERPDPPGVKQADWPRDELDRFILAKMEEAGLRPAEEAAPEVWLRRVRFDLVGLPPTPQEIEAFVADPSEERRIKVVEDLLASPHFGEKWARHWMDLVRYADTYGHEFDYPIHGSHEYRDYLVRAFNADLPYDQFVTEHIAGDLLETPRRNPDQAFDESPLATGFWYMHEATHAPTDVLANEADIMDNQLDVFGKSFLGLTVSCARCHDHKFDAISTADYYALTAYLQSSARQDLPIDVDRKREETRVELESIKAEADALVGSAGPIRPSSVDDPTLFEAFDEGTIPEGWSTTGQAFAGSDGAGIRFQEKAPLEFAGVIDSGLFGKKQVGALRSPTFTIEGDFIHLLVRAEKADIRIVVDNYRMTVFQDLLFKKTDLQNLDTKGEFAWQTLGGDLKKYRGHKAYLEFLDPGDGEIVIDEIRFSSDATAPPAPEKMVGPMSIPEPALGLLRKGETLANALPAPRFAPAMAQGTEENAHVYVRGSHRSLGEEVPARFLEALGGEPGDRLDLAAAVTDPANPLTARVYVNRVWHHFFGRGIVPTTDDFGPMGQMPSHPRLLDLLAAEFVSDGWSLKRLARRIVLSSTYRQASNPHPELDASRLAEVDPDNVLLHRMPVRRLPAESIRDSLLAVSGELDPMLFGEPIPTHRTEFMTGRGGRQSGPLDGAGRRTIYGAVYRNFLSPFLLTFDAPSPFGPKGRRSVSNVPAQALVLLNDPFVVDQTKKWGEAISSREGDAAVRVSEMALSAWGREPTETELERLVDFVSSEGGTWADLAHVLVNAKDFVFLR